jgi:hypothetical protein
MAARLIGYGLSTLRDPRPAEAGALLAAGCHAVFLDITHRTTGPRPARDAAFRHVRPGDCVVIVRLSRFAAGLRNLHDLLHQLDDARVGPRSLEEPIDTTAPDGGLVIRAVDATLQLQAAWIAEVTTEGQTAAVLADNVLGPLPSSPPNRPISHARCTLRATPPPASPPCSRSQHRPSTASYGSPPTPSRTTRTDGRHTTPFEHGLKRTA